VLCSWSGPALHSLHRSGRSCRAPPACLHRVLLLLQGTASKAWHGVRSRARCGSPNPCSFVLPLGVPCCLCCFRSSACTQCNFTASFAACTIMHASLLMLPPARCRCREEAAPPPHPSICVHACACPHSIECLLSLHAHPSDVTGHVPLSLCLSLPVDNLRSSARSLD
jgi:hypothetical protein